MAERLGLDPAPGRASGIRAGTALWLAPGAWMVVAEGLDEGALYQDLREQLQDLAAAVDQSHGRAVLRLAGARARDVLAKGCRLDLHPRAFRPGCARRPRSPRSASSSTSSTSARPTTSTCPPATRWTFVEWLTSSAAEFGYRIESAEGTDANGM